MSSLPGPLVSARLAIGSRNVFVATLMAAYLIIGTLGHDPWKPDEAYVFGIVFHILGTGDWVVPALGGEPFMEKPPLYYIVAALFARLFSGTLPLHDGARLASVAFTLLSTALVAAAARKLFGRGHAANAALLMLCSFGLAFHAHSMVTDIALLSGFAMAFLGLAWVLHKPRIGGAVLGTGIGIGFLSKGLVEPAMMGIAMLVLPALFAEYRSRAYAAALAWAALFATPWMLVWPLALYERSPELFVQWFWMNNVGRYFGFSNLGANDEAFFYTRTLPWFTLPAGPLAVFGIVSQLRRRGFALSAGHRIGLAVLLGMLIVLGTSASVRDLYALPVLVPLAVLGSAAMRDFPRRVGFAAAVATSFVAFAVAAFAWSTWAYGLATSKVPSIPFVLRYLPEDFHFRFDAIPFVAAAAMTLLWLHAWFRDRGGSWLRLWAANLAFGWGVAMALLLPWIDEAKSFRGPFGHIANDIAPSECVASTGLGEGQRGMLHYVAGIKTYRTEEGDAHECRYVLLQTSHDGDVPDLPDGDWSLVWEGSRNGERQERFLLYTREEPRRAARVLQVSR